MPNIFEKIHDKLTSGSAKKSQKLTNVPSFNQPLDRRTMYQLRMQRGVNLGSWFTLEAWLTGSVFQHAKDPKQSELDIVSGMKPQDAKKVLEHHWDHFINDGDWRWMASHGISAVRLPINYVHFLASDSKYSSILKGTEFSSFAEVYQGAWPRIDAAIKKAASHNIGVLIDLHGAPGGQNKDAHCGKSDGKVNLFNGLQSGSNKKATIKILVELANTVASYENVIGLELLNEPENHPSLEGFYNDAIKAIRSSNNQNVVRLPLYLGDAWNPHHYAKYVAKHAEAANPLVMDHHLYRCFTKKDHSTSAEDHARALDVNNGDTAKFLKGISDQAGGNLIIGEWSGALNPGSLHNCSNKGEAKKAWGMSQWIAFEQFTSGYFYWTLKKEGGPDPGWCFYTAVEKGIMPQSINPLQSGRHRSPQELQQACDQAMDPLYKDHCNYWNSKNAKGDHQSYVQGFRTAWTDSLSFLQQGTEPGLKQTLCKLRLTSFESQGHKDAWEFEHGYMQGLKSFKKLLYQ
ncbi:hypothetical protein MEQU1_002542 [Malassezia equina]|uniref:Glycoside hydrolase family 5 domain-containing protein n=1 Tax=Malassezia equina TaxID=1381935 RepID=A0AAF0EE27_9BASI|nr:hypothetical protein MEQU1_002542 [Malassezia equina]